MARNRSQEVSQEKENVVSDMLFTPVEDADEIASILAGAQGRGDYRAIAEAFLKAGIRLAQIPLDRGPLEGKKDTTVKSGFENVKTAKNPPDGADKLKVVRKDGAIFLVNQAVAA